MDFTADLEKKNFGEMDGVGRKKNFSILATQMQAFVSNWQDGGMAWSKRMQYE